MEGESADGPIAWHFLVKDFYDYAGNIEAVPIRYAYARLGASPECATVGHVQSMPLVLLPSASPDQDPSKRSSWRLSTPASVRRRNTTLKFPIQIISLKTHPPTNRYLLHYYFEIVQGGTQVKTAIYTEDIRTINIPASSIPLGQVA